MTVYDLAYGLAIASTAPVWLFLPRLRGKILDALRQRNGSVPVVDTRGPAVLIHAVSMGEINATTALVRKLETARPELRFIITTTSRTGEAQAAKLYEKNPNVTRIRFPFDFSRSVGRMLDALRPDVAVLMELEVWPNFTLECRRRGIPVILINGRLSAYSFRGYNLAGPLIRPMFSRLTLACVQDEAYADRFARVGVPPDRIRVTGTMKFDTAQIVDEIDGSMEAAASLGLRPGQEKIWVCGSTGPGEEAIVLEAYAQLKKEHPGLRLLIVPRHPERFDEVAALIQSRGWNVIRRSRCAQKTGPAGSATQPAIPHSLSPVLGGEGGVRGESARDVSLLDLPSPQPSPPSTGAREQDRRIGTAEGDLSPADSPVLLGDTMGELRKFYSIADVVFIGRTLVDLGSKQHGSDMIEPAALAKPVVVGPFTGNFTEVMNRFLAADAIREVNGGAGLQAAVKSLLDSPESAHEIGSRAREVVRANQGATDRHAEIILNQLQVSGAS